MKVAKDEARTTAEWVGVRAFALGVAACTAAVAAFLGARLSSWPPHEDETLALFVGREHLGGLFGVVLGERGGAPLHFLLAWAVVHSGGGLTALRAISALFAVASVPVVAALCARLAGRTVGLAATALVSASWVLLFHGVYGRMYSLFLLTSALSYLALLRALRLGGGRAWALWALAILVTIATHPYGALVLGSQVLYVLLTRERLREALASFAVVGVAATPFWRTDLVLAGRFDVGIGPGGATLGGPISVLRYLAEVAGDFSAGWRPALAGVLGLALVGARRLAAERPRSALLIAAVIVTPALALALARLGSSTSPESRHLIFALPFFGLLVAAGVVRLARIAGARAPLAAVLAVGALLPAEAAWAWHKAPALFEGEPSARIAARNEASAWLAGTGRRNDVLFGYAPLFLSSWERAGERVSRTVVPRADAKLALDVLGKTRRPLGRGVWVLDASDPTDFSARLTIALRLPCPVSDFEGRVYGPFLVIRTRRPTGSLRRYLEDSRKVMLIGKLLLIGDADINYRTVEQATARLAASATS